MLLSTDRRERVSDDEHEQKGDQYDLRAHPEPASPVSSSPGEGLEKVPPDEGPTCWADRVGSKSAPGSCHIIPGGASYPSQLFGGGSLRLGLRRRMAERPTST